MSNKYNFIYENCDFGNFSIPPLDEIKFSKSKSRIFIKLPLILNLTNFKNLKEYISILKNINGFMTCNTTQNHNLNYPLSKLENYEFYHSGMREDLWIFLNSELNINDLLEWERLRNGNDMVANLELTFSNYYVVSENGNLSNNQSLEFNNCIKIPYPIAQKVWMDFINRLNLFEYHLFELNNPIQDSEEMKRISSIVRESIHFFNLGGPMNWKNSVQKIREAMNHIGDLKKKSMNIETHEKKREDRWSDFFLALRALPNLAVHSEVDNGEWSREEAQAILTSFLGFWNIKDSILKERNAGQTKDAQ
ncbi:MAG: hypothetical protein MH321_03210 [Leptospiraceae bacterium]|nr:hypothetical protein [Leptospiraceae bacterium]